MNTIMMTTYLAGAIMGQASFGSMDKCKTAAEEVMSQEVNGLSVVCTYQQDAKFERERSQEEKNARFEDIFTRFLNLVRELQEADRKNEAELETPITGWDNPFSSEDGDSNWTIIDNHTEEFTTSFSKCGNWEPIGKLAVEPNKWITGDAEKTCKDF